MRRIILLIEFVCVCICLYISVCAVQCISMRVCYQIALCVCRHVFFVIGRTYEWQLSDELGCIMFLYLDIVFC